MKYTSHHRRERSPKVLRIKLQYWCFTSRCTCTIGIICSIYERQALWVNPVLALSFFSFSEEVVDLDYTDRTKYGVIPAGFTALLS